VKEDNGKEEHFLFYARNSFSAWAGLTDYITFGYKVPEFLEGTKPYNLKIKESICHKSAVAIALKALDGRQR